MIKNKIKQLFALSAMCGLVMSHGAAGSRDAVPQAGHLDGKFELTWEQQEAMPKRILLNLNLKYKDLRSDLKSSICDLQSIPPKEIKIVNALNKDGLNRYCLDDESKFYNEEGEEFTMQYEEYQLQSHNSRVFFRVGTYFPEISMYGEFALISPESGRIMPVPQEEDEVIEVEGKKIGLYMTFSEELMDALNPKSLALQGPSSEKHKSQLNLLSKNGLNLTSEIFGALNKYLPELHLCNQPYKNYLPQIYLLACLQKINFPSHIAGRKIWEYFETKQGRQNIQEVIGFNLISLSEGRNYCLQETLPNGNKAYTSLLFNGKPQLEINFDQNGHCNIGVSLGKPILRHKKQNPEIETIQN